jgi:hypothetical protein
VLADQFLRHRGQTGETKKWPFARTSLLDGDAANK